MRTIAIDHLVSPCCLGELSLLGLDRSQGDVEIQEGVLACTHCNREFPILEGIPRLVLDLSPDERSAISAIRENGLKIDDQYRSAMTEEERFGEIERLIRITCAVSDDSSEYLKRRTENDINFRVYECEKQDKYADTLLEFYQTPIKTMLDVGAGQGGLTKCLSKRLGADLVFIVDYDIEWTQIARLRNPGAIIIRADATRLPFRSEAIDCVVSQAMLEHVENYTGAANEICRITKSVCFLAWNPNKYAVYDFGHLDAPVAIFNKKTAYFIARAWHKIRGTGRSKESIRNELDTTHYIATTEVRDILRSHGQTVNAFPRFAINSLISSYSYRMSLIKNILAKNIYVAELVFRVLTSLRIEPQCYYILIKTNAAQRG